MPVSLLPPHDGSSSVARCVQPTWRPWWPGLAAPGRRAPGDAGLEGPLSTRLSSATGPVGRARRERAHRPHRGAGAAEGRRISGTGGRHGRLRPATRARGSSQRHTLAAAWARGCRPGRPRTAGVTDARCPPPRARPGAGRRPTAHPGLAGPRSGQRVGRHAGVAGHRDPVPHRPGAGRLPGGTTAAFPVRTPGGRGGPRGGVPTRPASDRRGRLRSLPPTGGSGVRPALDCMAYVTALLPVAQGVAVFAALTRAADRTRRRRLEGAADRSWPTLW